MSHVFHHSNPFYSRHEFLKPFLAFLYYLNVFTSTMFFESYYCWNAGSHALACMWLTLPRQ